MGLWNTQETGTTLPFEPCGIVSTSLSLEAHVGDEGFENIFEFENSKMRVFLKKRNARRRPSIRVEESRYMSEPMS